MICDKCNKEKDPRVSKELGKVCLCVPEHIGKINIPQVATTNPEYTMRMLSIMYKEFYYKGETDKCQELYKTLGNLNETVTENKGQGYGVQL